MIEEGSESPEHHASTPEKKRRLHGACDACRKKKVKCDSAKMPDNICTNCRASNVFCAHTMGRHVKKKDTQSSYIRSLEQRLSKMERSLQDIRPEGEVHRESSITSDDTHTSSPSADGSSVSYPTYSAPKKLVDLEPVLSGDSDDTSEAEDLSHVALANHIEQLSIATLQERFYGQSSGFMFLVHTSTIRNQIIGAPDKLDVKRFRRPIYWDIRPWEQELAASHNAVYVFPVPDLLENLVDLFFEKVNVIYPILHQPTFRKSLATNQHLWDSSFGISVLMVCAVGARYSDDPRAMLPGDPLGLSAGWAWFSQVPIHRNSLLYETTIYDLQYFVLAALYLISTSVPHAAWNVLGFAMRLAQEKGIHRRKGSHHKPSVEGELAKRAFWCLVALDRVKSSFLGRPCMMQDEDFDVEYPIECDDEYWETDDPEQAFKQPPGKPSRMTAFVCHLKLTEILVFTLKTLYATKKSKALSGFAGEEWERRIVSELDSSMNKWKETLPKFLQWDPKERRFPFFEQSANLHAMFYYLQILIHRPFLTKKSALSFPSLAMCTTAARSCSKVVEAAQYSRCAPYQLIISSFASGIVITLSIWGHMKSGMATRPQNELESLQRCMSLLQGCEKRFHISGRFFDMLETISTFDHQPDPSTEPTPRPRDTQPNNLPQPQVNSSVASYTTAPTIAINSPSMFSTTPQFPPAQLTCTNSNPDPTAVFPPNNWDLNNLLLLQMSYQKTNLGDNMDIYSYDDDTYSMGMLAPDENIIEDVKTLNNSVVGTDLTAEEMINLWSDIPSTFSVDDWNNYILNTGTNQR
ncbi:hypothetical protein HYPSUDRAFT_42800 [Hypholoma sublateritium FD-334 SS-4]|uniref:Zn(2)-C6 fungal-type domain-containing protein n=1 Tax=Hypholoma sublateritium (strain FD-334 SS-4) TaxID=945553 RepID=A0A0D2PLF5_HYPSF|nr:hypothetical protein HYPSUDRAFT_42800 [Hypholoma sublateritium FD-334 SS-4]